MASEGIDLAETLTIEAVDDCDILSWVLRRGSDGACLYVGSFGPEVGMISPCQGLEEGRWPWPECVGLFTMKDH